MIINLMIEIARHSGQKRYGENCRQCTVVEARCEEYYT